jgi:uncharacterized protein YndB with AHSA1/START domain
MSSIEQSVVIEAKPAKVFAALTEQAGYNGWWSKDCQIGKQAGDESSLKFDKQGTIVSMRFRIDAIVRDEEVRWTCVAHDMPDWVGTTLRWSIARQGDGTLVRLEHAGWKGQAPEPVTQGWQHFLASLRSFVETGKGEPW